MGQADFSFLDLDNFRKLYSVSKDRPKIQFYVEGIRCSNCLRKIESVSSELEGVDAVQVNMADCMAEITLSSEDKLFSKVADAITAKGFRLIPIKASQNINNFAKKEQRSDLVRLGVAGFCASNIMMFALASYFGAAGELGKIFGWLSLFLYLPVLFYVALPFYKGFIQSIQLRQLSIDGPMTIASLAGFGFSFYNLIRGQGSIYFDSLSGFLFLITLSRFIQKNLQNKFLKFIRYENEDTLSRAKVQHAGVAVWLPANEININDTVVVQQNEVIPVDGELLSERAVIEAKIITGESRPQILTKGMKVFAGAKLLSESMQLATKSTVQDTQWGKWIAKLSAQNLGKTEIQNKADQYSQILLLVVFVLSVAVIALFASTNPIEGAERALSLLIVACPCAMAFGTPLALGFSMRKAFKQGFLIRSADVFERISRIENIVFDKTGTLTDDNLVLEKVAPNNLSEIMISLILKMESISYHPIANAIREKYSSFNIKDLKVYELREISGVGVQCRFENKIYVLGSSHSITQKKSVALYENDQPLFHLFFTEKSMSEAKSVIQKLTQLGKQVFLLSGDHLKYVQSAAEDLGITKYWAEQKPEQKASIVGSMKSVMMIGDGVNDSLAFQQASVGIAVKGSAETAMRAADIYLMNDKISSVSELFKISNLALNLIKRNLLISLFYNLIAGTMALMGLINPLIAAVLMPISSGFILLSSWLGSRQ